MDKNTTNFAQSKVISIIHRHCNLLLFPPTNITPSSPLYSPTIHSRLSHHLHKNGWVWPKHTEISSCRSSDRTAPVTVHAATGAVCRPNVAPNKYQQNCTVDSIECRRVTQVTVVILFPDEDPSRHLIILSNSFDEANGAATKTELS